MARRSRSNAPTATLLEDSSPDESSALRRGLEVLRLISTASPYVSVDAIVGELGTTRATAQRLLATLVEYRFLRPSRDPDQFFADVSSLTVGRAYLGSVDGLETLSATLRTFQDVEKVSVTVWVRERAEGVCVASSGRRELLVGRRFDLDRFSAGHALMWAADTAVRIALLERFARVPSSGDRVAAKAGSLYGSFHQLETEGYCLAEATPEGVDQAIAFPLRGAAAAGTLAFSLESLDPAKAGTRFEQRAKTLVAGLSSVISRTFSL